MGASDKKGQTFSSFLSPSPQLPLAGILKSQAPFWPSSNEVFHRLEEIWGLRKWGIPASLGFSAAPLSAAAGVVQESPPNWAWEGSRGPARICVARVLSPHSTSGTLLLALSGVCLHPALLEPGGEDWRPSWRRPLAVSHCTLRWR